MQQRCCSLPKSCLTLCDPMDCRMPGFPVLHHLPEFAQIHVHWVSDAIQPPHPLPSPSPPALSLSQHQGLFQWISSWHWVAKVLDLQLQHQSFQWIFRICSLLDWPAWPPCSPRDSPESSLTPQIESINFSALNLLYDPTLTTERDCWEKTIALTMWTFVSKVMSPRFNMLPRFVIAFLQGASVF